MVIFNRWVALFFVERALRGNKPGYEVAPPMAIGILGGLFSSTVLSLLVLAVLCGRFAPKESACTEPPAD